MVKNPPANAVDIREEGLILALEDSPGGGGILDPLQLSCGENFMDRGAWQVTIHGVTEFDMTEAP